MHDFAIAWTRFDGLNIFVFGEIRRNLEVLIFIRPTGLKLVSFRHRQDDIGFANRPAFGEFGRRRQVFGFAFFRAAVHPGGDGVNFFLCQATVVAELPMGGIRIPTWHLFANDLLFDRTCPGARFLEGQKRERSRFAEAMAFRTGFVEDGGNVFIERHSFGRGFIVGGLAHGQQQYSGDAEASQHQKGQSYKFHAGSYGQSENQTADCNADTSACFSHSAKMYCKIPSTRVAWPME